jgi:uncharacterized LabA/DUF88 family protein
MAHIVVTGEKYGFIDGNYLDLEFKRRYADIVAMPTAIDFGAIRSELQLQRVYYYSAVDDLRRDTESDREFENRVNAVVERLDQINDLDGFHVRRGSVTGKIKGQSRRQKQVDVQLAVDALLHAINRNMRDAVLFAGDLDFKPLVDALVSLGIHTQLHCAKGSSAKEFRAAADRFVPLTPQVLARWAAKTGDPAYNLPSEVHANLLDHRASPILTVVSQGKRLTITRGEAHHFLVVANSVGQFETAYRHGNVDTLKRYFELVHGATDWSKPSPV